MANPNTSLPPVSVALPVYRDGPTLAAAVGSLQAQTHRQFEVLLVLNGADEATTTIAKDLAAKDSRIRLMHQSQPDLVMALNAALRAARFDLVARMDGDDTCMPERLALQASFLRDHPEIAAVASAYQIVDTAGRVLTVARPPRDPDSLRWRLLLGNQIAHGSVMFRRRVVVELGGYREHAKLCEDYDLWLRLVQRHRLACLSEVLYSYRTRHAEDPARTPLQGAINATAAMLEAWRAMPDRSGSAQGTFREALAHAIAREDGVSGIAMLESILDTDPSREALMAYLWASHVQPPAPKRAYDIARLARLREIGLLLRGERVPRVYLWGAGEHTRFILGHESELGLPIAGIVDDALHGTQAHGRDILSPSVLQRGEVALISSDWHEETIWNSSEPHRARGVRVIRMYEA